MFDFKVGEGIKKAWYLYKDNFWNILLFFILITIISQVVLYKIFIKTILNPSYLSILRFYFISYGFVLVTNFIWIKLILDVLDGGKFKLFSKQLFFSFLKFWNFIKTKIIISLFLFVPIYLLSLIMSANPKKETSILIMVILFIYSIYLTVRLFPAMYLSLDKNQGAIKNINEAWNATKDNYLDILGKLFLISVFIATVSLPLIIGLIIEYGIIIILGFIILITGLIVTFPMGSLLMVMLYREIMKKENISSDGAVQAEVVKEEIKLKTTKLEESKQEVIKE